MAFLNVEGTKIVNENGDEVILRGAGLGGWMCMENFISGPRYPGYPGCERHIREALSDTIGFENAEFFFDKFLECFFAEPDAKFFRSLGLNCIRIAVGYHHFEDDMNPRILKAGAFKHLDRAISICAKYSIYTVIDMHTAPGGQSGGWHADGGTHLGYFWRHKDFQDRLLWIWQQIAEHYKDNSWVAGYNVLNEPADPHPEHSRLINFYDNAYKVIRRIDEKHILFLDGNTFATDFTRFPDEVTTRWKNTAYSIHDYAVYGFPSAPEPYEGTPTQNDRIIKTYLRKRQWMDDRGLCVWNGEWGPVYGRKEYDGDATEEINLRRYKVLKYQLDIYEKDRLSWSIWLYKDIGFQGMVYVNRSTSYMTRFKDFLLRKQRLAADAWGKDDQYVKQIYQPISQHIRESVADESYLKLYPTLWSVEERTTRLCRTMLVAEFMVKEWADQFIGLDKNQLEELAKSFSFENCVEREGLNEALRVYGGGT
ncbi:glycoside hydrolase family 5 protein [Crepidotus variabilis]|uniref:Glycoside hydrolase family 5 protein n=1 Tax=Crepidotus variabilis TaxID=179855 RepID=A0A9P6JU75_9AGAR|nr:glycoside hydrolase family 5 protein [Crepidotus variabilis]